MNFINVPSSQNKYLFNYQLKYQNKPIGDALVLKIDSRADARADPNENIYLLNIKIVNKDDIIHFREILMQCVIKFINLISAKKHGNKLYLLLPRDSRYEIITAMSEYFMVNKTLDKNVLNSLLNKLIHTNDMQQQHREIYNKQSNMILLELSLSLFLLKQMTKQSLREITVKISDNKLKGYDKSYIINAPKINGLVYITLQNYFNGKDFNEITNKNNKPFLLWIEMMENYKFDTQYFYTQCYIMNILSDEKIIFTNKSNLYFYFKRYYPEKCAEYMAQSWDFKDFIEDDALVSKVANGKGVFIVRPASVGAYSGKDIYVAANKQELDVAIQGTKQYEKVLISEYITNPLLFNEKKFHLRMYFLVGIIEGFVVSKLFDFFEIFTATKPYKKADWTNKDIHDTHFRGSDSDIIYPISIVDSQFYNDYTLKYSHKIKDCLKHVSKFAASRVKSYSQTKNAFEIFGCDVLIKDDDSIVLMEINDKLGFTTKKIDTIINLSKIYFNTIINNLLDPILNNKPIDSIDWLYCKKIE